MVSEELLRKVLEHLEDAQSYTCCSAFSPSFTRELNETASLLEEALAVPAVPRAECKYIAPCWSLCRKCGGVHTAAQLSPIERKRLPTEQYEQIIKDNTILGKPRWASYDPYGIISDLEEAHGIKE
jgi:hypothetical protein